MSVTETNRTPRQIYARLLRYALPYWKVFLLAVGGMVMYSLTEASFAYFFKTLVNEAFIERDPVVVFWVPIVAIVLFIVRGASNFVSSVGMSWIGRNVIMTLRGLMYDHTLRLPVSYFDRSSSGEVVAKMLYNVEQVSDATTKAVTIVFKDGLTVVFLIGLLFFLSWKLTLIVLLAGPPIGLLIVYISRRFRRIARNIQDSMGLVTQALGDAVDGQRVIKAFNGGEYESARFAETNRNNMRLIMKLAITDAANSPIVQVIASLSVALVLWFAMSQPKESMDPGTFFAYIAAMVALLRPIRAITQINSTIQRGIAAGGSVFDYLDMAAEEDNGKKTLARARGDVSFQNLNFAYIPGKPIIKDFNLEVKAGETVAFVGQSGSGKTTLVNLVPRFYTHSEGRVLVDGVDVEDYQLSALRSQIALVSQDVTLFNDTVRGNIAYGQSEVDDDRLYAALKAAHALEFIEKLEDGVDTMIGENGVLLSGGQRQRLAIARALFKDAPILILDEATAALDNESEYRIQAALEVLMQNRTTLVIAHRLSTIENADRIVVMDSGKILEIGTHTELMAKDGHYAALSRMQFADEIADEAAEDTAIEQQDAESGKEGSNG